MKRLLLLPLVLLVAAVPLAGCHGDDGTGIDQGAVDAARKPFSDAIQRAGGDWDKLSPEDKKLFMDRGRGNEAAAKSFFGMMAGGASKAAAPPKR